MKKIYKEEWEEMMEKAVKSGSIQEIEFVWNMYNSVKDGGHYSLPF